MVNQLVTTKVFYYASARANLHIHSDGTATLTGLYSEIRGQGHATELMKIVVEHAEKHRLKMMLIARPFGHPIQTMLTPVDLVRLYERFGFVKETNGLKTPPLMLRYLSDESQEKHSL